MSSRVETSKRALFWNAAGSTAGSVQSFVLLISVTRICGTEIAGSFSVAFAAAQVLWTIGLFEATSFFATDATNRFSAEQYLAFKVCSCLLMLVCGFVYVWIRNLSSFDALLTIALCCFRLIDAFHEFFYALFQKNGRLDLSGFSVFCQAILSTLVVVLVLLICRNVIVAVACATIVKALFLARYDRLMVSRYVPVGFPEFNKEALVGILIALLPLFLSTFCANYISNITRFAIEESAFSSQQAVYSALFMPSFAINLLVLFFLRPSLTILAEYWKEHNRKSFALEIGKLLFGVIIVSLIVEAIASIIGIPLLQAMFGLDLSDMLPCLIVLLAGSGIASASLVLYNVFIVMRRQRFVLAIYCIVALLCSPISTFFVERSGLMGAAYAYVAIYSLMLALMMGIFVALYNKGASAIE